MNIATIQSPAHADYALDRTAVCALLNKSLATELVCFLRNRRHFHTATGEQGRSVAAQFREHADHELVHADKLAARIALLGGTPDFNPVGLAGRSHAEYHDGLALPDMIREDLAAERVAIDGYRALLGLLGTSDPSTRSIIEPILALDERHARNLGGLLESVAA